MNKIINLTPHDLNVSHPDLGMVTIPRSGEVARAVTSTKPVGEINGFPVTQTEFGDVEGLSEPREGVFFVVSRLVLQAAPHRTDLLAPGPLLRDEQGQVVGCEGFSR